MRKQLFFIFITFLLYISETQGAQLQRQAEPFPAETFFTKDGRVKMEKHVGMSPTINEVKSKLVELYMGVKVAFTPFIFANKQKGNQFQLITKEEYQKIYLALIGSFILIIILLLRQNHLRKKANKKLERSNEIKSRLFAILNHDLRKPVAGLISYLQLKTEAPDSMSPDEAALFEQKTIHAAKKLLCTMEDLLFWCKNQMQNFAPECQAVSVAKLFDETKSFFEYEEKIQFFFSTLPDLKIQTDEDYVKTIMRNLTFNAITALKDTNIPRIAWTAWKKDENIFLAINNNGPQIAQEKIDILYEKECNGSIRDGLGLLIIRELASAINCTIKTETDEIRGTTFLLIFRH